MSFAMTRQEREAFLAEVHVGILSVADEGRGPLTVPIWYAYDPGDALRYTIVISNFGAIPATGVALTDTVPVNTSYEANSLRLNGSSLGPDGGVSPLIAGLTVHSSHNPGTGIISAGSNAVITFDARVNAGVPTGTLISNQGRVTSNELSSEPTDADGLPSNGYQPTVIVVGDAQLLSVTKEVAVAGGGAATAGGQLASNSL